MTEKVQMFHIFKTAAVSVFGAILYVILDPLTPLAGIITVFKIVALCVVAMFAFFTASYLVEYYKQRKERQKQKEEVDLEKLK